MSKSQTTILVPIEPSLRMLLAGKNTLFCCTEDPELEHVYAVWQAMIAALKEYPNAL